MNSRQQKLYQELKTEGMSDKKAMFISKRMFARENGALPKSTFKGHTYCEIETSPVSETTKGDAIIAKLNARIGSTGGIVKRSEMPELNAAAPATAGSYQLGQYIIRHRRVDQLDQFTINRKS